MESIPVSDQALDRAHQLLTDGNYADALSSFESLAHEGVAQANVYLGWMHQKGLGTNVDLGRAEKCYKTAASNGLVLGQYYLATLLRLKGKLTEALQWYEKAAAQRHPSANYWASLMYREGEGTAPDGAKSEIYLKNAISLGHHFAERDLELARLRYAKNPIVMLRAAVAYIRAVVRGSVAAVRDPDEMRLH